MKRFFLFILLLSFCLIIDAAEPRRSVRFVPTGPTRPYYPPCWCQPWYPSPPCWHQHLDPHPIYRDLYSPGGDVLQPGRQYIFTNPSYTAPNGTVYFFPQPIKLY